MEVTIDPCVTGTVELLAMITDPKVSLTPCPSDYSLREPSFKAAVIVSDYFQDASHPEKLYKLGQAVRAKVVEVNSKPQRLVLSLIGW